MKKLYQYITIILAVLLIGCNSSELVENWKHPDIDTFEARKVLVIGITPDTDVRKSFEKKLTIALQKNEVNAAMSINSFDKSFTIKAKTETELKAIEGELISDGFDAILLSKVMHAEDKITVGQTYKNMEDFYRSFRDDYYDHQFIYNSKRPYEDYKVYHTETALYCVCPEKERELIWKGSIDITEPGNIKKGISDYVQVIIWALKEQKLLIPEDQEKYESPDI